MRLARPLALASLALALSLSTAAAQSAGALAKTAGGWRWSRGSLAVDLLDRGKAWSDAEADAVGAALDKLPDVLLRRAIVDMRVTRFYRDPIPVGRGGKPRPQASATTVIEQGFVAYGDALFGDAPDPGRIYATVTHELGHCNQYALAGLDTPALARAEVVVRGTPGFTSISWTAAVTDGLRSWNGFVSDYARTDDREDFAESVEFYWLAPWELYRTSPAKFFFMRDRVFGGLLSPPRCRKDDHDAIGRVGPEITSLGDTRDDVGSLVKVHGKHFMGPIDGGFNTVRYRGKKALHLAVSRSTVWSWVPGLEGRAPITVTTQDGTSAEAPFTATKPWWKFW